MAGTAPGHDESSGESCRIGVYKGPSRNFPSRWAVASNRFNLHREQRMGVVRMQQVVNVEAVGWAERNFRRSEGEGDVAGGRQAPGVAEMQQELLASADHFGCSLTGRGDAFAHDEHFAGR